VAATITAAVNHSSRTWVKEHRRNSNNSQEKKKDIKMLITKHKKTKRGK